MEEMGTTVQSLRKELIRLHAKAQGKSTKHRQQIYKKGLAELMASHPPAVIIGNYVSLVDEFFGIRNAD